MSNAVTKQRPKKPSAGGAIHREKHPSGVKRSGSVISFCVHGPAGRSAAKDFTPSKLIEILEAGLPVRELDELQSKLGVPMDKLIPKFGLSKATLHRRKLQGRLKREESDRILRYARLMGRAVQVLESEENARRWLTSAQFGLGGAVPLDYAETEVGAREVEDLLGRIEYGVYS